MAVEERAMGRIGLEGGRERGLWAQDVPNILLVIGQFCLFTGVEGSFMV